MQLSDFQYPLPDNRIAKFPLEPRDASKLLVYKQGEITHASFSEIATLLPSDSLLVFNNTKVIPARLFFQKDTGAMIEIFLLHPVLPTPIISEAMLQTQTCVWECMIGNKKKWGEFSIKSTIFEINGQEVLLQATLIDTEKNWVQFDWSPTTTPFVELVEAVGKIPLPPYLNRDSTESDLLTYQTIYSENKGAVAAPTAGLHFTDSVLQDIEKQGISKDFLTLHVGAGTFRPIKTGNVTDHTMHAEQVVYTLKNIETLLKHLPKIIPVGTTSMRALESLYWLGVQLVLNTEPFEKSPTEGFFITQFDPYQYENVALPNVQKSLTKVREWLMHHQQTQVVGETAIYIYPSYQMKVCRGIVTNFHQPGSTLIVLISTLIGPDWRKVYDEALENDYRFLSYGDSSLLLL